MFQQQHSADPFWDQHLQDRHDAIEELGDEVLDIHHALIDINALVEEHRPQLNTIESNADRTHERILDANRNLQETADANRNPVSKIIQCLFLTIVILALLVCVKFVIKL